MLLYFIDILKFNYRVLNDMQKKDPSEEQDFGQANLWKKARTKKWRIHK